MFSKNRDCIGSVSMNGYIKMQIRTTKTTFSLINQRLCFVYQPFFMFTKKRFWSFFLRISNFLRFCQYPVRILGSIPIIFRINGLDVAPINIF